MVIAVPLRFQLTFLCEFDVSPSEGRALRDDDILQSLPVGTTATMYFRDLGPQLGWTMVKDTFGNSFVGML